MQYQYKRFEQVYSTVGGNQMSFMMKDLFKEKIKRSRLRNRFLKSKSLENRILYTQQMNYCVSLLRKAKTRYYENLNQKKILDNKEFLKAVERLFSDKSISGDKINLTENGEMSDSRNEVKTVEVFNRFFSNIANNLIIPLNHLCFRLVLNLQMLYHCIR